MSAEEGESLVDRGDTAKSVTCFGSHRQVPPKHPIRRHSVQNEAAEGNVEEVVVYRRRWYILFAFSSLAFTQSAMWNTWAPITVSSHRVFGWNNDDIALLTNWGPIAYVLSMYFFSWMMDVKGLRWVCLLSSILCVAGAGVRCVTLNPPWADWLIHFGQILNGFAGPVSMAGPPVLSAVWFPPNQRTTSTAISSSIAVAGVSSSFLLGPFIVPGNAETNSSCQLYNISNSGSAVNTSSCSGVSFDSEKQGIENLLFTEFGLAGVSFIAILVYFPAKPPYPPSISASVPRMCFKDGLKHLFINKRFWLIAFVYGVSTGVFNGWQSVLEVNLKSRKISQHDAGWIGFYGSVGGSVVALILARLADVFSKHMRIFLLILCCSGLASFVWFQLIYLYVLPMTRVSLYLSVILATVFITASSPLLFELSCEVAYPIGESIANGTLTLINNISVLLFLGILMIPNITTAWMNWFMLVSIILTLPVLLVLKEKYSRLELDEKSQLHHSTSVDTCAAFH